MEAVLGVDGAFRPAAGLAQGRELADVDVAHDEIEPAQVLAEGVVEPGAGGAARIAALIKGTVDAGVGEMDREHDAAEAHLVLACV